MRLLLLLTCTILLADAWDYTNAEYNSEEESGSGAEEDSAKGAKQQHGAPFDIGNDNLMAKANTSPVALPAAAAGNIMAEGKNTTTNTNKTSDYIAVVKSKNTAQTFAAPKTTAVQAKPAKQTTNDQTAVVANKSSDQNKTAPVNVTNTKAQAVAPVQPAVMSSFVNAPPVGPMEKITVAVKGNSATVSNFTKPKQEAVEAVRPAKAQVVKFEQPAVNPVVDDSIRKTKLPKIEATASKVKKVEKAQHKKKSKHTKKHKNQKAKKNSKKSTVANFPKIILYQGPISKALESMLEAKSSPLKEDRIVSPISFDEATADIKRSNIARAKALMNHDDKDTDDYSSTFAHHASKKSKTHTKKKYLVKGYADSLRGDKKSTKGKKTTSAHKKSPISLGDSTGAIPILSLNTFAQTPSNAVNPFPMPKSLQKLLEGATKPLDSVKTDEEESKPPKVGGFPGMPPSQAVSVSFPVGGLPSLTSINGPKPANKAKAVDKPLPPTKPASTDDASDDEPDMPLNPAGFGGSLQQVTDTQQDTDDADEDIQSPPESLNGTSKNNSTEGEGPNIVDEPLLEKPVEGGKNPGTPKPVVNAPGLPIPAAKPPVNPAGPVNPANLNITDGDDEADNEDDEEEQFLPAPPVSIPEPQPEPGPANPNVVATSPPATDSEAEILERIQANSRSVAGLTTEIRDVEDKLEDLTTTMDRIEGEVERLDRKMNEKAKESFTKFAGPLSALQGSQRPFFLGPKKIKIIRGPMSPIRIIKGPIQIFKKPGMLGERLPIGPSGPIPFPFMMGGAKINPIGDNNAPKISSASRPKVTNEIFVPLPPPDSPAAKDIQDGKPVPGLPWPINEIVTMMMRQLEQSSKGPVRIPKVQLRVSKPAQPMPLPDLPLPPREHDIDRLEMEMGRTPVSRVNKKPKIIFLSKGPAGFTKILDMIKGNGGAPQGCEESCRNGGACMGGNVCKCPLRFTGPKCEQPIHRSSNVLEVMGGPMVQAEDSSHRNFLPLPLDMASNEQDDDEDEQKDQPEVEQSKVVGALSQILNQLPEMLSSLKRRSQIPKPTEDQIQFLRRKKH